MLAETTAISFTVLQRKQGEDLECQSPPPIAGLYVRSDKRMALVHLVSGWMIRLTMAVSGSVLGAPAVLALDKEGTESRCKGILINTNGGTIDERRAVCSAAREAIRLLGRCEIPLRRPLDVHILPEVRQPFGVPILGYFDAKQEKVVLTQSTSIPSLVAGTPYSALPRDDFYASFIVHEVVHGVMHQNRKRPGMGPAAYEYPAYALQIESLPSPARSQFLKRFDREAIRPDAKFSDALLSFDPFFFAARAYFHFKASRDSCAYLFALLEGTAHFIAPR